MRRNLFLDLVGSLLSVVALIALLGLTGNAAAQGNALSDTSGSNQADVQTGTPLSTTFTYRGQLRQNGTAVTAACNMGFRLFDDPSAGTLIGSPITLTNVAVSNGYFTVGLNYGSSAFDGTARWLAISVDCGSGFNDLTPRQALTAAPYALYATSTGALHGYPVTTTAPSSGQVLKWNGTTWSPGTDNISAGGTFWSSNGNSGTNPNTNFLGTTDNVSLTFRVSNTVALRLIPAWDANLDISAPNLVGGYGGNIVPDFAVGVTIGGGAFNAAYSSYAAIGGGFQNAAVDYANTVGGGVQNTSSGGYATVSGGSFNTASGTDSTVGGGVENTANGAVTTVSGGAHNTANATSATVGGGENNTSSAPDATVGGGNSNLASAQNATVAGGISNVANALNAVVGGGGSNLASAEHAVVSGGNTNTANGVGASAGGGGGNIVNGQYATIPGGWSNIADGPYSFAAGYRARANHEGTFVWADPSSGNFDSTANNQFLVRADGGVGIGTNAPEGQLHVSSDGNLNLPQVVISQTTPNDYARLRLLTPSNANWDIASGGGAANVLNFYRSDAGNVMSLKPWDATNLLIMSNGARLTQGGAWTNASDRNAKSNILTVDPQDILAKVATLPISTWNYKAENPAVRHIGPMAQDFYAAFSLGSDDKSIATVDEGGVALAAIQALYQQNQQLKTQVEVLQAQTAQPGTFNWFNLLGLIAFGGCVIMWIQQRRST
jgi:hypothetical protein